MNAKTARQPASRKTAKKQPRVFQSAMTDARCKFTFSDARSCGIPRWKGHPIYCLFHARQEQQLIDADRVGVEIASLSGGFRTTTDVNYALGKLFTVVAQNRIPPRNAALLAYIGQLLIHTVDDVENEISRVDGREAWNDVIQKTLDTQNGNDEEEDGDKEENDGDEEDNGKSHASA